MVNGNFGSSSGRSAWRTLARAVGSLWAAGILLAAPVALASVGSELDFHRGVAAFAEGKFDEAHTIFTRVLESDPEDTAALRYLGLIAQSRGEPEAALVLLERAVSIDGEDLEARVDLAEVLLQLDRSEEAQRQADYVIERDPGDARAQLYAGIAAYRGRRYRQALDRLEPVAALDPGLADQSRYYVGLAQAFLGDHSAAAGAFSDVEEGSPQSPLGQSARELGARVEQDADRWWAADVSAGLEFDSNPEVVNDDFQNEDPDGSGVFRLRGRARAPEWNGISTRAGYDGYLNAHFSVTDVDQQTHLVWAAAAYAWDDFEFAARYDYAFTLLPLDEKFRGVNRVTPSVSYRWNDWGISQLYYVFNNYNYFNDLGDDNDAFDRDGDQHTVGLNQFVFLPESIRPLSYARFGVAGTMYDPDGDEFEYDGFEFLVGGGVELPFEMEFATFYRFIYRNYANDSELEDTTRDDDLHWLSLELTLPLGESWTLGLNGSFLFNNSDIDEYEYDRQIVSSTVRYTF